VSRTAIAAFACLVAATCVSAQTTLTGRIVGITDGDTLTLLDDGKQQHRIRLEGIDGPESGQAFGNRAKQSLSDLAFDRRAEAVCPKTDRYGRQVLQGHGRQHRCRPGADPARHGLALQTV